METSTFVSVLLLISAVVCNRDNSKPHGALLTHSSKHLVETWISQKPAGSVAVAIVSPEDTEYFFAGQLSSENQVLPNEHTLFEIGSITKGFTGILLADQALAGNVFLYEALETSLIDWPGRFQAPAGNINLVELATHSSGLPREPDNMVPYPDSDKPYVDYTKEKLYDWLDDVKLVNRGTLLYSNAGVGILGHALEVRARKKYQDLLKERVLIPLGLYDTTITLNSEQNNRLAPGHDFNGNIAPNLDFDVLAPAGALRSTLSDLMRFVRIATGLESIGEEVGKALSIATIARTKPTITDRGIGLCWASSLLPNDKFITWHNGGTIGYNAYVGWVAERQIGIAILANIAHGMNDSSADSLALDLFNAKLGL